MGDVTYKVIVEYATKGSLKAELPVLTGNAAALSSALRGGRHEASALGEALRGGLRSASEAFTGTIERAGALVRTLGAATLGAGIGAAIYGVGHLNAELEQTSLSLAAIFNAQGYTKNFTQAMGLAGDQVAKMKQDVRTLPGDLGQLAAIMTTIATPAAQSGSSPDDIRKLAGRSMLVGQILRIDQATTAREMAELLSGRAGAHNILGTRLGFVGDKAKELNADSPAKRMSEVNVQLAKFGPAAEAFGHSWVSIFTTFKDDIKYSLLAPASSPLFAAVKQSMVDADGWFIRNKDTIAGWSHYLGTRVADAWRDGMSTFERWWPSLVSFTENAYQGISRIWIEAKPYVEQFGAAARRALADPATIGRVEEVLKLYAMTKLGSAAVPAIGGAMKGAGSMASLLGGGTRLASMVGAGGAETGGIGSALGGAAVTGPAGAAALVGLGVAAMATWGALNNLTDATSKYHESLTALAASLRSESSDAVWELRDAAGRLLPAVQDVSGWMGNNLVSALNGVARSTQFALRGIDNVETFFGDAEDEINRRLHRATGGSSHVHGIREREHGDGKVLGVDLLGDKLGPPGNSIPDWMKPGDTHVTNNNYFTISSNHEPSRIARDVVDKIADSRRFPVQSRHVKNPSGTT